MKKGLLIGLGILVGVVALLVVLLNESPEQKLKRALGLKQLPASVHAITYNEETWTDTTMQLYFELAPQDFPKLLEGRGLKGETIPAELTGNMPPKELGNIDPALKPFPISAIYRSPESNELRVTLETNQAHDRVHLSYFVN